MQLAIEALNSSETLLNNKIKELQPLLKWAGGKEGELKYILPNLPKEFVNYYEPFVGGGAVYTSIQAQAYFINDKSEELISLYRFIATSDKDFHCALDEIVHNWEILSKITINNSSFFLDTYKAFSSGDKDEADLTNIVYAFIFKHSPEFNGIFSEIFNFNIENFIKEIKKCLVRKICRMKALEELKFKLSDKEILDNIETALKGAFYMHFRYMYNNISKYKIPDQFRIAIFLFIRNYAYSGMFRYNSRGGFNVPYGGIGYNKKNFSKKISFLRSIALNKRLSETTIESLDFESFLRKHTPTGKDFIFLDPPYDTEFSTYAQNKFAKSDQERLANYLINECEAKWMMIIKNTEYIYNLYSKKGLVMEPFDKKYLVSFMNRNNRNVQHLMIKNY